MLEWRIAFLQISTADFCLRQKLPTTPGLWSEDESAYVINGAPLTVMMPSNSHEDDDGAEVYS